MRFYLICICIVYYFVNVEAYYLTTTTLSIPRSGLGACEVLDRFAIFAGGETDSAIVPTVDIFDTYNNMWLPSLNLSTPRTNHSVVDAGTFCLIGGGIDNQGQFPTLVEVLRYSGTAVGFKPVSVNLSQGRIHMTAVSNIQRVLFIGGFYGGKYSYAVDIVSITDFSTVTSELPSKVGRAKMASVYSHGTSFVAGGYGIDIGYSKIVEAYNITTGSWRGLQDLSEGRLGLTASNYDNFGNDYCIN